MHHAYSTRLGVRLAVVRARSPARAPLLDHGALRVRERASPGRVCQAAQAFAAGTEWGGWGDYDCCLGQIRRQDAADIFQQRDGRAIVKVRGAQQAEPGGCQAVRVAGAVCSEHALLDDCQAACQDGRVALRRALGAQQRIRCGPNDLFDERLEDLVNRAERLRVCGRGMREEVADEAGAGGVVAGQLQLQRKHRDHQRGDKRCARKGLVQQPRVGLLAVADRRKAKLVKLREKRTEVAKRVRGQGVLGRAIEAVQGRKHARCPRNGVRLLMPQAFEKEQREGKGEVLCEADTAVAVQRVEQPCNGRPGSHQCLLKRRGDAGLAAAQRDDAGLEDRHRSREQALVLQLNKADSSPEQRGVKAGRLDDAQQAGEAHADRLDQRQALVAQRVRKRPQNRGNRVRGNIGRNHPEGHKGAWLECGVGRRRGALGQGHPGLPPRPAQVLGARVDERAEGEHQ
eukprot:m.43540 g.43540  ORF g.43540 m.43540 type:complete len:457 (-) comp5784_c0_seq3:6461-7831(-)